LPKQQLLLTGKNNGNNMQTEIEAKSLTADHEALRARLCELGAVLEHPMRLMRRYNFDFPDERLHKANGWARVRDEGGKITASYKQLNGRTLHGTKEVCVTVSNFDDAKALFESLGLIPTSYQETKRESWHLSSSSGDLEIELDHWPWTEPYIEIEAPNEAAMRDIFTKLGLDYAKAVFGSVEVVYQNEYDVDEVTVQNIETIRFELPVPDVLAAKRKVAYQPAQKQKVTT